MTFAPLSLILANNFLLLNEALYLLGSRVKQYSVVKIKSLYTEFKHSDQSFGSRAPRVGDEGTIVEVYGDDFYIECSDKNGVTIWLEIIGPNDADLELLYI